MKFVHSIVAALVLLAPVQGTLRGNDNTGGLYDEKAEAPKLAQTQEAEKRPEVRSFVGLHSCRSSSYVLDMLTKKPLPLSTFPSNDFYMDTEAARAARVVWAQKNRSQNLKFQRSDGSVEAYGPSL